MAAGVHDSFWTHACDVDKMNQILREQFVELYNIPILENVRYFNHALLIFYVLSVFWSFKCHNTDHFFVISVPLSVQLHESFQTSFPTLKFPPLPERGNFDLREVLKSPYFFNWFCRNWNPVFAYFLFFEFLAHGLRQKCTVMTNIVNTWKLNSQIPVPTSVWKSG